MAKVYLNLLRLHEIYSFINSLRMVDWDRSWVSKQPQIQEICHHSNDVPIAIIKSISVQLFD
jgi:hypothetical protein